MVTPLVNDTNKREVEEAVGEKAFVNEEVGEMKMQTLSLTKAKR
jgi:hypothetical protein